MAGRGSYCDCCKKKRCNRRSRIRIGPKSRNKWVYVCGQCTSRNMEATRAWIARLEAGEEE